jgi:ABC-type multidrug transport system ATPase subunit
MIEARGLVERNGSTFAGNDLSLMVRPGLVTGFLGPTGAGKTTTILSLDYPTAGMSPSTEGSAGRYRARSARLGRCSTPRP